MMNMYESSEQKKPPVSPIIAREYVDSDKKENDYKESIKDVKEVEKDGAKIEQREFTYDATLINLKLIGQLEEDQKLRIKGGESLDIDTRYAQIFWRSLFGDSRDTTIDFISALVASARTHSHELLAKLELVPDDKDLLHKLNNITSDLNNCLHGLKKLKLTYKDDRVIKSKIKVIADKIRVISDDNISRRTK